MVDLRLIGLDISGVEKVAILGKRNGCCQLVTFGRLEILESLLESHFLERLEDGFRNRGHPITSWTVGLTVVRTLHRQDTLLWFHWSWRWLRASSSIAA